MPQITTAVVDIGITRSWDIPERNLGMIPRAEILFHGNTTVPSKLTTDTTLYTLDCQFPSNFVYRIVDIYMLMDAPSNTAMAFYAEGIMASFIVSGVVKRRFALLKLRGFGSGDNVFFVNSATATNDFTTLYQPLNTNYHDILEASNPGLNSQLFFSLVDITAGATEAINIEHQVRAVQYTIEQYNRYGMNLGSLVIPY